MMVEVIDQFMSKFVGMIQVSSNLLKLQYLDDSLEVISRVFDLSKYYDLYVSHNSSNIIIRLDDEVVITIPYDGNTEWLRNSANIRYYGVVESDDPDIKILLAQKVGSYILSNSSYLGGLDDNK